MYIELAKTILRLDFIQPPLRKVHTVPGMKVHTVQGIKVHTVQGIK